MNNISEITPNDIIFLVQELGDTAINDIQWSENIKPPSNADNFAFEAIWIICNSGMKHTIARQIEQRVIKAIHDNQSIHDVFKHKGKASAMTDIWDKRLIYYHNYNQAIDKLSFLESMPWIGKITKYHLAKNFGFDCAKPDIHLQRLADRENKTVHDLCENLAIKTGYRIATIDLILWRACATGLINSKTGEIKSLKK